MNSHRGLILGVLLVLLSFGQLAAQSTPQVIKVQGFLSDTSGGSSVPAAGTFSMTFALYDAGPGPGGLLVASVGPLSVDVTDGLYSVDLAFVSAHFDGTERYIEITVDAEVLSPRVRMVSAPFAYKAETLDGAEAADLEESEEIATAESNLQLQIDDINSQMGTVGNTLDDAYDQGGPGVGKIITADEGPVSVSGSDGLTVDGVVRVGIGASNETALNIGGGGPQITIRDTVAGVNQQLGVTDQGLSLFYDQGAALTVDRVSGNVGIGTGSPIRRLTVNGETILLGGSNVEPLLNVDGPTRVFQSGSQGTDTGRAALSINQDAGFANADQTAFEVVAGPFNGGPTKSFRIFTAGDPFDVKASFDGRFVGGLATDILQITGGADIAEPFKFSAAASIVEGAVVVIDDENPGHLTISQIPYDTRVAGIVSGAGGINPGLTLNQDGVTDGEVNVAMAGRVYTLATTSNGTIRPGDLLTTSSTPGHAMRVDDVSRAAGTIVGKAMSALEDGQGLILVLVNLQ